MCVRLCGRRGSDDVDATKREQQLCPQTEGAICLDVGCVCSTLKDGPILLGSKVFQHLFALKI